MARRGRTLSCLIAGAAICLAVQSLLATSFVQKPAPKGDFAAAAAAAAALGAPLAAYAGDPIALSPWKGPLYGADVCSTKPLFEASRDMSRRVIIVYRVRQPHHHPADPPAGHSAGS
eukprot:TRINITY_DN242_c1_g1_i3.p2 TRINITY_DN242_c1_g1~~TRINITY_DN242_c1_g1_i3.p2  ORF type:complete len:117 (-),score=16.10 TRINITY_DN242_c1_g1_i3:205-555(-)